MRFPAFFAALALPAIASAGNGGVVITTYTFESAAPPVDLGMLDGFSSVANDINDNGDIVGKVFRVGGNQAFVYLDGMMYSIHTGSIFPSSDAEAFGINNDQIVVGEYREADSPYHTRAFYYYPGIWMYKFAHDDAANGLGFDWETRARAINRYHRVAGQASRIENLNLPAPPNTPYACYDEVPVTWLNAGAFPETLFCPSDPDDDNKYEDNGTMPIAYDINDSGNMVGGDGERSQFSMFLYKNGVRIGVPAPPNATGPFGRAYGINNKDQVVGTFGFEHSDVVSSTAKAFFWDGTLNDPESLGTLPGGNQSQAYEINEQSIIAGSSDRSHTTLSGSVKRTHAIVFHKQFGMKQLPALGSTTINGVSIPNECQAFSLNNRKSNGLVQVVGKCKVGTAFHAVRWDVQIKVTSIVL